MATATVFGFVFIFFSLSCSSLGFTRESEADGRFFYSASDLTGGEMPTSNVDLLEFPLNLEFLEAEFFLWGSLGRGLDSIAPQLASGGPSPIASQKAHLSPLVRDIIAQFAFQEVGHVNDACSLFLDTQRLKTQCLVAGLLGVESGQDAVLRALLYQRAFLMVEPYEITVAEFTDKISKLRNELGNAGVRDEGIVVKPVEGAEARIRGNVLAGDQYSLSYERTPEEILRIEYGSGKENVHVGFYPKEADGRIAKSYLS